MMVVLLLLQMAYHFTGRQAHEWTGATLFALFVLHYLLNFSWSKNLFRGKYTPTRIVQTVINMMLLICVIGLIISGLILSRHVFTALPIPRSRSLGRTLHHICAYWGFILMSAHLGLHANIIMGAVPKSSEKKLGHTGIVLRSVVLLISGYGAYAFIKHNVGLYMLNVTQYAFFDYEQPILLFFAEYIAILVLFAYLSHLLVQIIIKHSICAHLRPTE